MASPYTPAMMSEGSVSTAVLPRPAVGGLGRRIGALLTTHTLVDVYAAVMPPILAIMETRLALTRQQTAWLLGIASVASGLSQPIAAWLSDRLDTRVFGPIGLLLGAVSICMIGSATTYAELVMLFAVGMIGVGMYHPVGASSTGQLSERRAWPGRSLGMSMFFVAGMVGGVIGSYGSPRIVSLDGGFELLRWFMVPGVIGAMILLVAIRRVPHRHDDHREIRFDAAELRSRWLMMALLYIANALRFTVNMTLYYLLVRWATAIYASRHPDWSEEAISNAAAAMNGTLNACVIVGMAIGGMTAGSLIRPGREKWPLVLQPLVFAPFVALYPLANAAGGHVLAVLGGIGFAAMIPVSLSLGQRLLPHRTSLSSGLLLGGAWTLAVFGPPGAEACLTRLGLSLGQTFGLVALLMALSGVVLLPLRSKLPAA